MTQPTNFARLDAPIVLAHGLGGFARIGLGRFTLTTYFHGIPEALRAAGNRVLVPRVPPLAGVETRARRLGEQIEVAFGDEAVHLVGHSMGGLDSRALLADPRWRGRILSVTTIGTPHLGSTLADFAKLRVGRVYNVLAALKIDPQGCLDITRNAARRFHESHPAPDDVPCFSIAGNPRDDTVCWALRRVHEVLWELEGPSDGLVSVESASAFGTPLPFWPVDHLRQLNWLTSDEPDMAAPLDLHAQLSQHLAALDLGTAAARRPVSISATPIPNGATPVLNGATPVLNGATPARRPIETRKGSRNGDGPALGPLAVT